jgi:hypothetical protein
MKTLTNAADIAEVLGGEDGLVELTSSNKDAVWQWLNNFMTFPSNTFVVMTEELKRLGYTAPPELWKMRSKNGKVFSKNARKKQVTKKRAVKKARGRKTGFIAKARSKNGKSRMAASP